MGPFRMFNYGGGVQSNAVLVLAAQGELDFKKFVFANVGDDSENPETIQYIREVARPYAIQHDIEIIEVQRRREGAPDTIQQYMFEKSFVPIPMFIPSRAKPDQGAPIQRICTAKFKVIPIESWVKEQAQVTKTLRQERHEKKKGPRPLVVHGFGISVDEWQRMRLPDYEWQEFEYPLIDRKIDRAGCLKIIADAGLPAPPKSACWFCPYHSKDIWQAQRREQPALFAQAAELEKRVQELRRKQDKPVLWLTKKMLPLVDSIPAEAQPEGDLDGELSCDSGYCFV